MFAGLNLYESVLLVLGIVLFVALLVALLRNVFKNQPYAALLPAFLLPVAMIGYPSIQSIQYNNGLVEIQKATDQVAAHPNDVQARAALQALEPKIAAIAPRAASDPQANETLRRARIYLQRRPEH